MAIIKQHDKRSGITYVYESIAHWDPVKKMSCAKRTLIGRLDPQTGEIVPTDGRNKRKSSDTAKQEPDYKILYEQLLGKYKAQETLLAALKKQIAQYQKDEK